MVMMIITIMTIIIITTIIITITTITITGITTEIITTTTTITITGITTEIIITTSTTMEYIKAGEYIRHGVDSQDGIAIRYEHKHLTFKQGHGAKQRPVAFLKVRAASEVDHGYTAPNFR